MRKKPDTGFGLWSNPLLAPILIFVWVAILLTFRLMPQWDLVVSSIFYDPSICSDVTDGSYCIGFPAANDPLFVWIRNTLNVSPRYIGVGLLLFLIIQLSEGKRPRHKDFRNQLIVLMTLVLGPLLVVNLGLKQYFGRVRPRMIEDFGGTLDFTRAGDVAGQCASNCSFVSGEASTAGWMLCCGLLFAPGIRKYAYIVLLLLGVFMATLRVVFGAHFISDVLLGYLVPLIICSLLAFTLSTFEKRQISH